MRAVTFAILLLATASPAITIDTAVAQTQSSTKIASTVLATVNGQRLTQGMVDWYIEHGEFLAGHKFSQAEKSWYTDLKIKHFRKFTDEEIQDYKVMEEISRMHKQLLNQGNPVKFARLRENIMTTNHLRLLAKNKVNTPSLMTIVYKYSPVLYANPKHKLVITKRTIDSVTASRNLVAKIAGKPLVKPDYRGDNLR